MQGNGGDEDLTERELDGEGTGEEYERILGEKSKHRNLVRHPREETP